MARVWVVVASKYGATREIGEAIADELGKASHDAALKDAEGLDGLQDADAIVLGSAIYAGKWLQPADSLVREGAAELASRPVWLFSSGPVGEPPKPEEAEPEDIDEALKATGARGHAIFAGKLDYEAIGKVERLLVKALKAPEGDFRDWDAIREWARSVAAELADAETER
jgi:menaquinone-dependent protoporphyrinogen oxidase